MYVAILGTSIIHCKITAPCDILHGDKIVLECNPVLMQCTMKLQANQRLSMVKTLDCPVKNCLSSNLKKLSNHLIQVHHIKSKAKRKKLQQKAKRVSSKPNPCE